MYIERRRRFLEAMGPGAVALLLGARPARRSADTEYRFRQDSDFWYLTGFDHPHAVAVLRTDGGPPFALFVEPRDPAAETWTGVRPGVDGAVQEFGADEAHPTSEFLEKLPELIRQATRIHHVFGRDPSIDAKLVETLEQFRLRSRNGVVPASEIVDPRGVLHEMRLFKTPAELEIMRQAQEITREAHHEAARRARGGVFEYELEAVIDYTFRRRGATGAAYNSIVGGGVNSTILHYVVNDQKLEDGSMVLIDAGCELKGYAADVTRTYPVGGRYEGSGREIYEVVLQAQLAGLAEARPGSTLPRVHDAVLSALVEGLVGIGLLHGDPTELVALEAYKPYYMHSTSHWLGLDVHDVGAYTLDGKPRALEPGMVFTVEPGLYVSADAEAVDPRFRGIGVRIEDDVVITRDGHENLSAAIPKHPDDVEEWVRD